MPTGLTREGLIRRDRQVLFLSALGLVSLCWLFLAHGHSPPTPAHTALLTPDPHAMGTQGFLIAFSMWMVMMVAMMLPPVMPWILLFAATTRRHDQERTPYLASTLFVSGYFSVWAIYSLGAAAAQLLLQHHGILESLELKIRPQPGGMLLLAAGLFQLSRLKSACMRHCRSPLGFFLTRWREGHTGAFCMGFSHGSYCVGCCWALMALSFALGVMNLLWMAGLTLFLCLEKIAPAGPLVSRSFGFLLMIWGLWLLASPG